MKRFRRIRPWQSYIRRRPPWTYIPQDTIVAWWYRLTYCRRYGHQTKMDMQWRCVNCGKAVSRER